MSYDRWKTTNPAEDELGNKEQSDYMKLNDAPETFLSKLPIEERQKLGHHLGTAARELNNNKEAQERYIARTERELQQDVANYLNRQGIPFINARADKKTTIAAGAPDFVACLEDGKFLGIECKCKATRGRLSPEQEAWMGRIISKGGIYMIIYSIEELIRAISEITCNTLSRQHDRKYRDSI